MKKLYSYQKKAYSLVLKAINKFGKALMVMAPGLGKTVVSSFLLSSLYKKGNKVLCLCHNSHILTQCYREFRETFDPDENLVFYNFFGLMKDINEAKKSHVVFASFQLFNSKSKWYQSFKKKHFDIIIVDEGHHAQAPTFREVIEYFTPKKALCMTGTPDRMDKLNIRHLYGEEVVNIPIEEGIAKGWLTKVEYHILSDGLSKIALEEMFQNVLMEKRRITINQINKQLFVKKRDKEQISQIKKYTNNWQKKCIIFCESIHHVRSFARNFEKGKYCTFHSENSTKNNNENLHAFKHGEMNIILSVNKFNEGIDIPDVEVIVFLRATESGVVYRQQLGRGLRKKFGKSKVVVLDFVGNTQRILMIQGMLDKIQAYAGPVKSDKSPLSVEGDNFSFRFTDELENILEILRVARMGFYETWQEASKAAITLSIKTGRDYRKNYKEDQKLMIHPDRYYDDFPGWDKFLGKNERNFYPTWQEASKAAIKLRIKSVEEYNERYKEDLKLPSSPRINYKDFPNWRKFLGKYDGRFYETWQEASKAAIKLRIKSQRDYIVNKKYKGDSGLHVSPQLYYDDFPGWDKFLGKNERNFYPTWQEASKAAIKLGVKSSEDYAVNFKKYKTLDKRLHNRPSYYYKDFPGWKKFLGKE